MPPSTTSAKVKVTFSAIPSLGFQWPVGQTQDRFKQYAAAGASTAALVEMSGVIANKEGRLRKRAIEQSQIARNINAKSDDAKAIEKSEAKIKEILKQMSEEGGASDNSESSYQPLGRD
ncbi:MAG: hypothetical protein R2857_12425 [Vampirovibrionales bacterium]